MEDNTSRAIMIGVGLFVVMLVTTGVLLYVNAARKMATAVDKSLNSWDDITYNNIMDYRGDITIECTGIDFINFLRKNFMRQDIYITLSNDEDIQNFPISWWKNENTDSISEIKLARINTNAKVTIKKEIITDNNDIEKYIITVIGEIFSSRDAYITDSVWNMKKDVMGRYAYVTDENVVLEIGDVVNYTTSKAFTTTWRVLGADNGKILLLGDYCKVVSENDLINCMSFESFEKNCNKLFENFDNGNGAMKGSVRCLNFDDIAKLSQADHSILYTAYYGVEYTLKWNSEAEILVNGHRTGINNIFYWYNKKNKKIEMISFPNELPIITDDSYSFMGSYTEIPYLTEKAKSMLDSTRVVFLNISTRCNIEADQLYYCLQLMSNCEMHENFMFDFSGSTLEYNREYWIRPVISLESGVTLIEVKEGEWNIVN